MLFKHFNQLIMLISTLSFYGGISLHVTIPLCFHGRDFYFTEYALKSYRHVRVSNIKCPTL